MDSDDGRASSPTPGRIFVLGDGKSYLTEEVEAERQYLLAHPESDYSMQREARIAEQKQEVYNSEEYFGKSTSEKEREETSAPRPQDSITSPDSAKRISETAIPEKLVSPAKT